MKEYANLTALVVIGAAIGIGQLLTSPNRITARLVVGRALVSAGLAASSTSLILLFPDLTPSAQMGLGAAFASLGTSGIERLLQRVLR